MHSQNSPVSRGSREKLLGGGHDSHNPQDFRSCLQANDLVERFNRHTQTNQRKFFEFRVGVRKKMRPLLVVLVNVYPHTVPDDNFPNTPLTNAPEFFPALPKIIRLFQLIMTSQQGFFFIDCDI